MQNLDLKQAGFGGGCHWCTEAVFESLIGVTDVQQGWIASDGENDQYSEAVIVDFDPEVISFKVLINIHLHTHQSTSNHSFRWKYRSAVYFFSEEDALDATDAIAILQEEFDEPIITKVLPYRAFRLNREESLHYYASDPSRPFCETYINPKLQLLRNQFSKFVID